MRKTMKKLISTTLALAMTLSLVGALPAYAAAEGPILEMTLAHKIDVALAVGPTTVDYSTFEADLRYWLKYEYDETNLIVPRENPVPDEDVYIMASQAVSASTTAEFSWWTYDHTRPVATYGGASSYDETTHTYVEAPALAATSTASATYLQDGTGVNYAPGVWGPAITGSTINNTPNTDNYAPGIGYQYADVNLYLTDPTNPKSYPIEKYEMNPDPTNPDLESYNTASTRRLYHPYQGNNTHMVSSNNGATMDFYGYPQYAFRDWQYLPNDQKTMKTFEFSIAEDRAFDALDGTGFFFNTEVNGSYAAGTQTMSGYLLFLQYNTSGVGTNMTIYKFKDVNTKAFHNTIAGTTSSSAQYTVAGYNGTTNATSTTYQPQFIPVARSAIYTATDFSRRIRIEASPTMVKVYYNGSTVKNDATVLDPNDSGYVELTADNLVDFNAASLSVTGLGTVTLQQGTTIAMDPAYIGPNTDNDADFGFGPMAAYLAHGCARPTHIAMQNLSMTVEKVKSLTEVVREPEWHENTHKFLVNLNENEIADFEENAIIAELLARLTNDDIYYVGWGATINAIASAAFLRKHSLKGMIIDIESLEDLYASDEWKALSEEAQEAYLVCIEQELTYDAQIRAIAEEIHKRYWSAGASNHALVSDNVVMEVTGADMQNTIDASWPYGKWMIEHIIDESSIEVSDGIYMTNFKGQYTSSGLYMDDLEESYNFPLPGRYLIYYRDIQVGELFVHRPPVADFSVTLNGDEPVFVNLSYDPDVFAAGGVNGAERGIVSKSEEEMWSWIDISDDEMLVAIPGLPATLEEGDSYMITLTVEDFWGATASYSHLVTYSDAESGVVLAPFGDFTLTPASFIKASDPLAQEAQKITLTNKSYDPAGLTITSEWTVYKDDVIYTELTIDDTDFADNIAQYVVGTLPAGKYKIVLVVTNSADIDSVAVAKFFEIVEDAIPPSASITPSATPSTPQTFTGNTNLALTFSDTGGSGFRDGRFAVVTVAAGDPAPAKPASSSSEWKAMSVSPARTVLISAAGINYVFWEAWDKAGNYASGSFGPYTMDKKEIFITLTASPRPNQLEVVYNAIGEGIELTATFYEATPGDTPAPPVTGTVFFYQNGILLGSGIIGSTGANIATLAAVPIMWGPDELFTAVYSGDPNYGNATADITYPVVLCNCEIVNLAFDGAEIHIPWYSSQASHELDATAEVELCGRAGHFDDLTITYDLVDAPTASTIISNGKLIVNGNAVGTDTVEVKVTITQATSGHSETKTVFFSVVKDAQPTEPPTKGDTGGAEGSGGSGIVDKNDDEPVEVDISSMDPDTSSVISFEYTDGPDKNDSMQGTLREGPDYSIVDGVIVFSEDFLGELYAGEHEFVVDVDGNKLVFYLYIAYGELIMEVANDPNAPAVNGETDDFEVAERADQDNKDEMDMGYNVYIYLVVSGELATDPDEKAKIEDSSGNKKIGPIFDIALIKSIRDSSGDYQDDHLSEVDDMIWLVVDIPVDIQGKTNYVVVRAHTDPLTGDITYEELLPTEVINNGTQLRFPSDKFSAFAILYDEIVSSSLTISFEANGGSGTKAAVRVAAGASYVLPANPFSYPGYVFSGWKVGNAGDVLDVGETIAVSNDISLYAQWENDDDDQSQVTPPDLSDVSRLLVTGEHIAYVHGRDHGLFAPEAFMTRAEAAQMFYNLLRNKDVDITVTFTDVADDMWYSTAVNVLASLGIIGGFPDGGYHPDENMTRAQFAAIVVRFAVLSTGSIRFDDVPESYWAFDYISTAADFGWIQGIGNGLFAPGRDITRAEVVTLVNRMLGRSADRAYVDGHPDLVQYPDTPNTYWAFYDIVEASVGHDFDVVDGAEFWK